jgi:hypothetical protein
MSASLLRFVMTDLIPEDLSLMLRMLKSWNTVIWATRFHSYGFMTAVKIRGQMTSAKGLCFCSPNADGGDPSIRFFVDKHRRLPPFAGR